MRYVRSASETRGVSVGDIEDELEEETRFLTDADEEVDIRGVSCGFALPSKLSK